MREREEREREGRGREREGRGIGKRGRGKEGGGIGKRRRGREEREREGRGRRIGKGGRHFIIIIYAAKTLSEVSVHLGMILHVCTHISQIPPRQYTGVSRKWILSYQYEIIP